MKMLAVLFVVIAALGCTVEFGGSSADTDLSEFFTHVTPECNVSLQDGDAPAEIELRGTLTAIKEADIEWLTVEGFIAIGDAEAESIGTARLEDRLFQEGDTWEYLLTTSRAIEGFVPVNCNVQINAQGR